MQKLRTSSLVMCGFTIARNLPFRHYGTEAKRMGDLGACTPPYPETTRRRQYYAGRRLSLTSCLLGSQLHKYFPVFLFIAGLEAPVVVLDHTIRINDERVRQVGQAPGVNHIVLLAN